MRRASFRPTGVRIAGKDIRTYMGDGRGHWEGNTMVVETTNFVKDIAMNGINFALLTDQLRIVERFTPHRAG